MFIFKYNMRSCLDNSRRFSSAVSICSSRFEEDNFGIASADEASELDSVGIDPAGELLSGDCVGVLPSIEAAEEG